MSKVRYYLVMGALALMALAVLLGIVKTLKGPGPARATIGMQATDGYQEELEAAMSIWNGFVGCQFLVAGDDTFVKSDDGEPCGDPMRPEDEWGHAATAYKCRAADPWAHEILISQPGNINTQACIIAHEIGHRLGAHHHIIGVMGSCSTEKQNILRIRDEDSKRLKKEYCE